MTGDNADAGDGLDLTIGDIVYAIGWHMDSQRRIYDALLALIHIQTVNTNLEGKAKELQALHERGKFLYPPPAASDANPPPTTEQDLNDAD